VHISGLFYYPIKSCAGVSTEAMTLDARGPVDDRRYMLVAADGRFLTQREHARMALIRPEVLPGGLRVRAPGQADLVHEARTQGRTRPVVVWRDTVAAHDQGDEAAAWLSEFLGAQVRLVRLPDDVVRPVSADYAVSAHDQVGFADGYPLLLISEDSLLDLNARLDTPLPMNRFRPNVVVRGAQPYAEDGWRTLRAGALLLHVVKPCARCVITTTDQRTTVRSSEPLRTLAAYRKTKRGVMFGQNVIHSGPGALRVGSQLLVLLSNPVSAAEDL
jgi:hypothetical protein